MLLQDVNSCGINLHLCRLESECEGEQITICADDRRETYRYDPNNSSTKGANDTF